MFVQGSLLQCWKDLERWLLLHLWMFGHADWQIQMQGQVQKSKLTKYYSQFSQRPGILSNDFTNWSFCPMFWQSDLCLPFCRCPSMDGVVPPPNCQIVSDPADPCCKMMQCRQPASAPSFNLVTGNKPPITGSITFPPQPNNTQVPNPYQTTPDTYANT